jgi:hypothetical protein
VRIQAYYAAQIQANSVAGLQAQSVETTSNLGSVLPQQWGRGRGFDLGSIIFSQTGRFATRLVPSTEERPATSRKRRNAFLEGAASAELRQKSSEKSPIKSRVGQRFLGQRTWVCYGCNKGFHVFLRVLWVAIRAS